MKARLLMASWPPSRRRLSPDDRACNLARCRLGSISRAMARSDGRTRRQIAVVNLKHGKPPADFRSGMDLSMRTGKRKVERPARGSCRAAASKLNFPRWRREHSPIGRLQHRLFPRRRCRPVGHGTRPSCSFSQGIRGQSCSGQEVPRHRIIREMSAPKTPTPPPPPRRADTDRAAPAPIAADGPCRAAGAWRRH